MAITESTKVRNDLCSAGIQTDWNTDGRIDLYTGSQPASADNDIGAVTLLVTLSCAATAMGAPSAGTMTFNAITSGTASATGTATWGRLYKAADGAGGTAGTTKARIDFSVTATGGGGDVTFNTTSITNGSTVAISSLSYQAPT